MVIIAKECHLKTLSWVWNFTQKSCNCFATLTQAVRTTFYPSERTVGSAFRPLATADHTGSMFFVHGGSKDTPRVLRDRALTMADNSHRSERIHFSNELPFIFE